MMLRQIGLALCLVLATQVAGAQCLDEYRPAMSGGELAVQTSLRHDRPAPPMAATGSRQAASGRDDAAMDALDRHDLAAFERALPTDPVRRKATLRSESLLVNALWRADGAIARRILAMDPTSASTVDPNSLLEQAAQTWVRHDDAASDKDPLEPLAWNADALDSLRLMLSMPGAKGNGQTLALLAALRPSVEQRQAIAWLLGRGASIDLGPIAPSAPSALAEAAKHANALVFCQLVAGRTPGQPTLDEALASAPLTDDDPISAWLLEHGANVNTPEVARRVEQNTTGNVQRLLLSLIAHGFDPNGSPESRALLTDEAQKRDLVLVHSLLVAGADPNYASWASASHTPLVSALTATQSYAGTNARLADAPDVARRAQRLALVQELVAHGADPLRPDLEGKVPIAMLQQGDDDIAAIFVTAAAGPGRPASAVRLPPSLDNEQALRKAIDDRSEPLAILLIDHGLAKDTDDLFMSAARSDEPRVLAALIARGARPYPLTGSHGDLTPLIAAAYQGATGSVRFMLDHGLGDVNEHCARHFNPYDWFYGGETPLIAAAQSQSVETVRLLLERGADPKLGDARSRTPLEVATFGYRASPQVAALLTQWMAKKAR